MNTLTGARCTINDAPLMESTAQADHEQAAKLCGKDSPDPCPAFAACGGMARGLQRGALDHRPVGTWAGVLYPPEARERAELRRGRERPVFAPRVRLGPL